MYRGLLSSILFLIFWKFWSVKADGYPKLATLGVIAGALTNIVLDYISVGLLDMGIAGAAWATGISQFVTFLIFTYHFIKGNSHLKLVKVVPKLSWFKKSLPLGVSNALTEISSGILVFAFNHEIFRVIGDSGLVSYTIISYVYNIVLMAMVGLLRESDLWLVIMSERKMSIQLISY